MSDDFLEWVEKDMPMIQPSDSTQPTPAGQMDAAFSSFCDGMGLAYGSEIRNLQPHTFGVWELKSPDLRFISWFPAKNYLVVHLGGDANWLHEDLSRYTPLIEATAGFRESLSPSLPGPIHGVRVEYVVSNRT